MTTIPFRGAEIPLQLPRSFASRYDIVAAGASEATRHRAIAAALGACWGEAKTRTWGAYAPPDVSTYGGRVIDALCGQGAKVDEILEAGAVAYNALAATVFTTAEVDDATVGFPPTE